MQRNRDVMNNYCDLHLHTTASDGSDTPAELIEKAMASGMDVISITDHDTLEGLREVIALQPEGVKVITGVEFSCSVSGNGGFNCHILGYGFDPDNKAITDVIRLGREKRLLKLEKRLVYLKEKHGIEFSDDEAASLRAKNSVAKPHIARLIIKRGLAESVADAIEKYLKGARFPDDRFDASCAIEAVRIAGGRSVYAHPLGGEREKRLTRDELRRRVVMLKRLGACGLECYYSRYNKDDIEFLISVARENNMLISGGSDYHGANKTVVLGSLSENGDHVRSSELSVLDCYI